MKVLWNTKFEAELCYPNSKEGRVTFSFAVNEYIFRIVSRREMRNTFKLS